jgi:hypothetical protein
VLLPRQVELVVSTSAAVPFPGVVQTTVLGPVVLALVFAVLVQNADAAKFW